MLRFTVKEWRPAHLPLTTQGMRLVQRCECRVVDGRHYAAKPVIGRELAFFDSLMNSA